MPICLINCQLTNDIDNKKTWTLDKEKKCFPINIKALLPDLTIINLYINLAWLSVCLYPINVKTAEPIRPKFCLGLYVALGKVYENDQNLKNLCLIVFFSFFILYKEKMLTDKATIKSWIKRWARSALKSLAMIKLIKCLPWTTSFH